MPATHIHNGIVHTAQTCTKHTDAHTHTHTHTHTLSPGRLMGAIRPVGVVGGKRNVPNWGDGRATDREENMQ